MILHSLKLYPKWKLSGQKEFLGMCLSLYETLRWTVLNILKGFYIGSGKEWTCRCSGWCIGDCLDSDAAPTSHCCPAVPVVDPELAFVKSPKSDAPAWDDPISGLKPVPAREELAFADNLLTVGYPSEWSEINVLMPECLSPSVECGSRNGHSGDILCPKALYSLYSKDIESNGSFFVNTWPNIIYILWFLKLVIKIQFLGIIRSPLLHMSHS